MASESASSPVVGAVVLWWQDRNEQSRSCDPDSKQAFPAHLERIENAPSFLAIVATGDKFPQRDIVWLPALGSQTSFRSSRRRRRNCRSHRTTRVRGNCQRREASSTRLDCSTADSYPTIRNILPTPLAFPLDTPPQLQHAQTSPHHTTSPPPSPHTT